MKCEKCNSNKNWLWGLGNSRVCGSCAIQLIEPDTDLDAVPIIRGSYPDQFTTAPRTNNTAVEAMINGVIEKCLQQTR